MIKKEVWEKNCPDNNPFLKYEFFHALFTSGSIGRETGWEAQFLHDEGILINFLKSHSYGEYIFDWSWAEAYGRHRLPYYPKLTSMIPFTPVTTHHFLMKKFDPTVADNMLKNAVRVFKDSPNSSSHYLFLPPEEVPIFLQNDFKIRHSLQYHFYNEDYLDFDQFLSRLKTKKAKNIRSERIFKDILIRQYTGDELQEHHADLMYEFYISTIENKNSYDYLNQAFFRLVFQTMRDSILFVLATKDEKPIAGSLFFYDKAKLYGRYWGAREQVDNLHFELCYYQGIDFCLKHKIPVFEAGAQGEHKISRGFRPVTIYSAHQIKHEGFKEAIEQFIDTEKEHVELRKKELTQLLPFR